MQHVFNATLCYARLQKLVKSYVVYNYCALRREAKYRDECVCLSVREYISLTARLIFTNCFMPVT